MKKDNGLIKSGMMRTSEKASKVMEISIPVYRMMSYIMKAMKLNDSSVFITQKIMSKNGIKNFGHFQNARKNLVRENVIVPTNDGDGRHLVNPRVIFYSFEKYEAKMQKEFDLAMAACRSAHPTYRLPVKNKRLSHLKVIK